MYLLALLAACSGGDDTKPTDTAAPVDTGIAPVDEDGDGFLVSEGDCDDSDPAVNPDATETCNEVDDNCDGATDEALTTAFWLDADGDGHGDADLPVLACDAPAGAVADHADCDDADPAISPDAAEVCDGVDNDCSGVVDDGVLTVLFADADGDGHGDPDAPAEGCEVGEGFVLTGDDCDDASDAVHPGAEETDCLDPVDYNCDGSSGYADADGDGHAACAECDDTDPAISPDAAEACNTIDDDCDGETDEAGATGESGWHADADADGYGDAAATTLACDAPEGFVTDAADCDDADATVSPAGTETCDGADEDCDGTVDDGVGSAWYTDADADTYGDPAAATYACDAPTGTVADATDCDDADATVSPAGTETCNDRDDDCDGTVDDDATDAGAWHYDGDGDGYGNAAVTASACDAPAGYVASADDCNDGAALASPAGVETCDGIDNDCDGATDESGAATWYLDADGDGYGDLTATTAASCTAPAGYVGTSSDCDDATASVSPAAAEACDGLDNDCDGDVDETGGLSFYADADGDGYGDATAVVAGCTLPAGYATNDDDCDDALTAIHPGAAETCDSVDEDCDGTVDEDAGDTWYADADGDGYGAASPTTTSCTEPAGYAATDDDCDDASSSYSPGASEVCDDGLDQDCDGTADDGCPDTVEHCGTISADETWSGEDIHHVTCDVYVQGTSAPLLTIEDGATVEFAPGAGLIVGYTSYGELWVDGHTDGVLFTSDDTRPSAGDWDGLYVGGYDRGTWIEGATIEYGGNNGYANVYAVNTTLLTILDSVIADSSNSGIYVSNATLDLSGSTVSDNADDGVSLTTNADLSTSGPASFSGNTLSGNGLYPLVVPAAYVGEIDATNTFAGNATDYVYVYSGTVATDTTWYGLDVPYYVAGDVTFGVAAGMTMTIADGAELAFASGAALNIGTSSYVDFVVDGTTAGVTFTSSRATPRAGDWDGLSFGAYVQRAEFEGATIEYGGANGYGNLYVYYPEVAISLTNSAITDSSTSGVYLAWLGDFALHDSDLSDNADYGLYAYDNATLDGDLAFTGNTVTNNDIGLSLPAQEVGALGDDGTYGGNVSDDVELRADTFNYDATMRALDVPYHVVGDLTIGNATYRPTLTIEDGAELRFDSTTGLYAGTAAAGTLDVQGSTLGVTFTSAEAVPAAGDWEGIYIGWHNLAVYLRGATVEYGGDNGYGNLYLYPSSQTGGTVLVEDSIVRYSSNTGLYAASSVDVEITGTTFEDNADYGVYFNSASALETTGEPTFTGNTMTGNGLYPIVLDATSVDQLDASSTFTGNGVDRIFVNEDTITTSGTWQDLDAPYYMNGDTRIEGATSPVITIEVGTSLLFNYYASLSTGQYSYGELQAVGTLADPIVFTSAQPAPLAGDWDGLLLATYDTGSALQYIEVSYGGENARGNIYLYNNATIVTISDALVSYSEAYGIYRTASATALIADITYLDNASGTFY
ncbi:MAG: MopE-related protein [Pseudomonadota bacterium]|nr:MopE-related protein [Pseudomonadota bacterium]